MTPKVLLIEDDVPLRRSLVLALEDEGFAVREAGTGREALAAVQERPDAVVLDLGLPDADGVELCARLRERTTSPILAHSVRRSAHDLARTLDAGADDYLTKPFPVGALADHLRALLAQPRVAVGVPGDRGLTRDGVGRTRQGARVELTPVELHLLVELAAQHGAVVPRDTLLERVWALPPVGGRDVLEARLRSLSSKLQALGGSPVLATDEGCRLPV